MGHSSRRAFNKLGLDARQGSGKQPQKMSAEQKRRRRRKRKKK